MGIQIHRDLSQLPAFRRAVITIGSFDGVHIGHQFILRRVAELAKQAQGESVVISFYPHPRKVFGDAGLRLLNTLEEKAMLLERAGIEHLVVVPFSRAFAEQSPDAYIHDFLVQSFHPHSIVIGYDHRYGKGRQGDISYLKKLESVYHYHVEEISKQEVESIAVSSTKVRHALAEGDVANAARLLGYPYFLSGVVAPGLQIGNKLGFPTANIRVEDPDKLIPPQGIYAVYVEHRASRYKGMLYIGNRPTIDEGLETTIEVNIFDFNQQIYGEPLRVSFVEFLRSDARFDSLDELQRQLAEDKKQALSVLG